MSGNPHMDTRDISVRYYEYPHDLKSGATSKHWISFDAFAFNRGSGSGSQTLDIALYIPNDALQTAYKSEYSAAALGQVGGEHLKHFKKVEKQ